MTDLSQEHLVTVKQCRNEFPNRPSIPTIWRWMSSGVRGTVLESMNVGGRRYTSKEAIARFTNAINEDWKGANSPKNSQRIKTAKAVLDSMRI